MKRLATAAKQIHSGDLNLDRIVAAGPREVATTTDAFNDMASTLKAVESKAVALANEDLSNPELRAPLFGRTGQALQATVEKLSERIREREAQRKALQEAATRDRLTGLFNRAAIFDFLTNDVERRRQSGERVGVLFIDLDGLKPLNDDHGHEVGDSAIMATAKALSEAIDSCDVVGRLGGDEFLVVLCHEHSQDGQGAVERLGSSVARRQVDVDGMAIPLRASVGIALAECGNETDPMELVRKADQAMYEAKREARAALDRSKATKT